MSGTPGRSGPPGNQNAIGNAGGHCGGAPAGNSNGVTHGVFSYLATGRLPSDCDDIATDLERLRTDLARACVENHGTMSLTQAAVAQSAARHEAVCRLLLRWLAQGALTTDQRLATLKELSRATDKRDAAIKALGLDVKPAGDGDRFAFLTPAGPVGGSEVNPAASDASAAQSVAQAGDAA